MIRRPACCFGLRALEAQFLQIQLINKHIDYPYRVVLGDVIFQALGK